MAITITSVSPTNAPTDGGTRISIIADFSGLAGQDFHVHVGPNGDDTDPQCHSGVAGQGHDIQPLNATLMECYLPDLPKALTAYDLFMELADASDNGILAAAIQIYPRDYKSLVFALRRVQPPYYHTGARNMEALTQVEELP